MPASRITPGACGLIACGCGVGCLSNCSPVTYVVVCRVLGWSHVCLFGVLYCLSYCFRDLIACGVVTGAVSCL